jgi:two-component system C4-dicarboxylate transport response regulator DctD
LLDDDPSVLKATRRLLVSAGCNVETFSDPILFLRYAENRHPSVAVIDILMPVMNGLEVQARLQTISPVTRVIILTSKDDSSVRRTAMDAGASAFFLKPVDQDKFLSRVQLALSESHS